MLSIKLKGSITTDGQLILQEESLLLPPGEVDVIVLFPKTTQETDLQSIPYTAEQKAIVERFLNAAETINSGDTNSSVKVDEVLYGSRS
jgi:hypothetical protein